MVVPVLKSSDLISSLLELKSTTVKLFPFPVRVPRLSVNSPFTVRLLLSVTVVAPASLLIIILGMVTTFNGSIVAAFAPSKIRASFPEVVEKLKAPLAAPVGFKSPFTSILLLSKKIFNPAGALSQKISFTSGVISTCTLPAGELPSKNYAMGHIIRNTTCCYTTSRE